VVLLLLKDPMETLSVVLRLLVPSSSSSPRAVMVPQQKVERAYLAKVTMERESRAKAYRVKVYLEKASLVKASLVKATMEYPAKASLAKAHLVKAYREKACLETVYQVKVYREKVTTAGRTAVVSSSPFVDSRAVVAHQQKVMRAYREKGRMANRTKGTMADQMAVVRLSLMRNSADSLAVVVPQQRESRMKAYRAKGTMDSPESRCCTLAAVEPGTLELAEEPDHSQGSRATPSGWWRRASG
jgi:hypothetical protein